MSSANYAGVPAFSTSLAGIGEGQMPKIDNPWNVDDLSLEQAWKDTLPLTMRGAFYNINSDWATAPFIVSLGKAYNMRH